MRKQRKPRAFNSLQEWMEWTGTNQQKLIELVANRTDRTISRSTLSGILTGSRRCSRWNAYVLQIVTGVSAEILMQWPRYENQPTSRTAA